VGNVSLAAERVHSVFVDPSRQGRGIGAAMMAFIEKLARRQGALLMRTVSIPPVARFRIPYSACDRRRPARIRMILRIFALEMSR
jgi:GNAT superfamily N-acetyltransferase